jgi:hypothetical protein
VTALLALNSSVGTNRLEVGEETKIRLPEVHMTMASAHGACEL